MSQWKVLNIWPDELINLQMEIAHHHPELGDRLDYNNGPKEWEAKIADIAHFCDLILHGDYLPEDMIKICEILRIKLIARRKDNRGLAIITTAVPEHKNLSPKILLL